MGAVNVSVSVGKLDEITKMLAEVKNGVPKALVGAINDTTKTTKTQISKSIRERVNIKKKDIDDKIDAKLATPSKMHARIILSESKRLGLIYFGAKQDKRKGGGVRYKIDKKGGRQFVRGAFILKVSTAKSSDDKDKFQVFKRVGKRRFPIRKLQGISPWGAFVKSGMRKKTQSEALALLEKNLDRRVNFLLLKHTGQIK